MAITDHLKTTEIAVNNSEGSFTVADNTTEIRISAPIDFEMRIATGGDGSYCAKEDHIHIGNATNLRGLEIFLWSAGNNDIHVLEYLGVVG